MALQGTNVLRVTGEVFVKQGTVKRQVLKTYVCLHLPIILAVISALTHTLFIV